MNSDWGVRDLDAVSDEARALKLDLERSAPVTLAKDRR
jgi:hypothetical protein